MTSSSSAAHHNNQTNSDLTALYTNFSFYKPYYGENPRSFIQGHDFLDDKVYAEELRLASKTGGMFDWIGGISTRTKRPTFKSTNSIRAITTTTTLASPPIQMATADSVNM